MNEEEKKEVVQPEGEKAKKKGKRRNILEEHIEFNQIDEKGKKSMLGRTIIAIALVVIAVPCIVFGGWFWVAFCTIGGFLASLEITKVTKKSYPWWFWAFISISVLMIILWPIIYTNVTTFLYLAKDGLASEWEFALEDSFVKNGLLVQVAHLGIILFVLFWLGVGTEWFDFHDVSHFFVTIVLVGLGFQAMVFLRFNPYMALSDQESFGYYEQWWQSCELIFFVLVGTCFNDIFAYFTGVLIGKHHMNEKISPKKTWEGFFGGWVFGTLAAFLFGFITAMVGSPMVPGMLDSEHWYWILIISIILPIVGDLGDLSFSLIKRNYNTKDYSKILGPHGGVLDRCDSILFNCLGTAILIMIADLIINMAGL